MSEAESPAGERGDNARLDVAKQMATFGTISEFVEGTEDWTEYVERLGHFFRCK